MYSTCIHIKDSALDGAMRRFIKPHHPHIGSLLAYFFLNYVLNGKVITIIYHPQSWEIMSLPVKGVCMCVSNQWAYADSLSAYLKKNMLTEKSV